MLVLQQRCDDFVVVFADVEVAILPVGVHTDHFTIKFQNLITLQTRSLFTEARL